MISFHIHACGGDGCTVVRGGVSDRFLISDNTSYNCCQSPNDYTLDRYFPCSLLIWLGFGYEDEGSFEVPVGPVTGVYCAVVSPR